MAGMDQQPIHQYRNAKGAFDASFLHTDLRRAQSAVRLQLAMNLFHGPPSLVRTYHLSGGPLVQIGPQDFRMFWADGAPFFPQHRCAVAAVPQTQAGALHPAGFAARGSRETGHPDALRIGAWHMGHPVFHGFILDRFPWPGKRKAKAPAPRGGIRLALADHLPMLLGALGCVPRHHNPRGPRRWHKGGYHRTEQRIFGAVFWRGLRPNEAQSHGEAIAAPCGAHQSEASPQNHGCCSLWRPFCPTGFCVPRWGCTRPPP